MTWNSNGILVTEFLSMYSPVILGKSVMISNGNISSCISERSNTLLSHALSARRRNSKTLRVPDWWCIVCKVWMCMYECIYKQCACMSVRTVRTPCVCPTGVSVYVYVWVYIYTVYMYGCTRAAEIPKPCVWPTGVYGCIHVCMCMYGCLYICVYIHMCDIQMPRNVCVCVVVEVKIPKLFACSTCFAFNKRMYVYLYVRCVWVHMCVVWMYVCK